MPEIEIGTKLPQLKRRITLSQMVAYAGATWDWHKLHYDLEFLQSVGLEAPVIDGQIFGALMAEAVTDWAGPSGWIVAMDMRYRAMAFAGAVVEVESEVVELRSDYNSQLITIAQKVMVSSKAIVAPAHVKVKLPRNWSKN